MISIIEEDKLNRKIFKVIYEDITFKWEELDIKLFDFISKYYPLSFAVHNDFLENDKDKISYKKFINTYRCFITINEKRKNFIKEI